MRILIFSCISLLSTLAWSQRNIITIGRENSKTKPPYLVQGIVSDAATGEVLPGVNVVIERQNIGTTTDFDGAFSLSLYKGFYDVKISSVGFGTEVRKINVLGSGKFEVLMSESLVELESVVVSSESENSRITSASMGRETLTVESIKSLPPLAGEVDILKSITLLPGVSAAGEASSSFSVRGGGFDQNLILLNGATIYNPSHLFGFFSAFNASVIRNVELYKGVVPANYAGRGSSIVDLSYRKGNFGQWNGDVTVGMATSKFSAGGPIIPGQLSVLVGGRISYSNWLLGLANDPDINNSAAEFYDGNIILSYVINDKNDIEYSLYHSFDEFQFASDTSNSWKNTSNLLKWNSSLTSKLSSSLTATWTDYQSSINGNSEFDPFELGTGIDHKDISLDLEYALNDKQTLAVGGQAKFLQVNLGVFEPGAASAREREELEEEKALESGVYFQYDHDLTSKLTLAAGLRYSNFRFLGPNTINTYSELSLRSVENIETTNTFGDNELITSYDGLEPRVSLSFQLNDKTSVKGGYNKMYQYIHLVSNTTSIAPTDVWKLSDPFIEPEIIDQYSVGIFRQLGRRGMEVSVESYYKETQNVVEYKDGADLFLNPSLETELLSGIGRSYGLEFYLNKPKGRLSGWLSYTYARSFWKVQGAFEEERINGGDWYRSNFDKPHNLNTVAKYRISRLITISGVFTYSTGRPQTIPVGKFLFGGEILARFEDRNTGRIPDYHRFDLSFQFRTPSSKKIFDGEWSLSVYNLYGRRNAYSVFFQDAPNFPPQPFQLTVVGFPLPAISYEVKF